MPSRDVTKSFREWAYRCHLEVSWIIVEMGLKMPSECVDRVRDSLARTCVPEKER